LYIKNRNPQQVPGANDVVVRHGPHPGGQLAKVVIELLRGFENRLRAGRLRTTIGRNQ